MGFFKKVSSSARGAGSKAKAHDAKFPRPAQKQPQRANASGKRGRITHQTHKASEPKRSKREIENEEIISSSEDEEQIDSASVSEQSGDEFEEGIGGSNEFGQEENQLLESVKKAKAEKELSSGEESDEEAIKVAAPIVHRRLADSTRFLKPDNENKNEETITDDRHLNGIITYRPHRFSPVCLAFSSDGKFVVSCSKDGSIAKYDLCSRKTCNILKLLKKSESHCHKGRVLCCAISPDDKYVATGGEDKAIKIWNFLSFELVKEFNGAHRSDITSLVFRKTHVPLELFSGSTDRSVKAWNLDQMGFVDTMYGHQDAIQQLDMLSRARVLSCGGQDRTLRLFKVAEESQFVFNGYAEAISIDTIAMINEDHFLSGAADGSIYVWSISKKKPVCVVKKAHGLSTENGIIQQPNWISSIAACPYTDLVASGSCDGLVRLWKLSEDYKYLKVVDEFALKGFINDIRFADDGSKLACAVGQEHRLGRWWKIAEAKNSVVVIPLVNQTSA